MTKPHDDFGFFEKVGQPMTEAGQHQQNEGEPIDRHGETFFVESRLSTPDENLSFAIGLIQAHILAGETLANPNVIFGQIQNPRASLEMALSLLAPLGEVTEDLAWPGSQVRIKPQRNHHPHTAGARRET